MNDIEFTHFAVDTGCAPPFYYYTGESVSRIGEAIANGCNVDAPGSLAAWFSNHSKVYAFDMPGKRYDIGDLKSYEYAKMVFGIN